MKFTQNKSLFLAWSLTIVFCYPLLGFLDTFYKTSYEVLLLVIVLQMILGLFTYYGLGKLISNFIVKSRNVNIRFSLFLALLVFLISLTKTFARFPTLFDSSIYLLRPDLLIWFLFGNILGLPVLFWTLHFLHSKDIQKTRLFNFIDSNLSGLLLFFVFFAIYFLLANIFNQPHFNFDDIFFDTDAKLWRARFGTEHYEDVYWRTVHPFVLIVVRPWANLIALFLKGNLLYASFVLIAITGALAVFLVWYFVRETTKNSLYALFIATLFGASSSQLIFGSILETYGFLGTFALIFVVLLLKDAPRWSLVATGLAAFGITISNIAQTVIAHFMVKRNFWQLVKYGLICLALIVPLNLLNNFIYPNEHPYLWEVSTLQFEEKNVFPIELQRAN